MAIVNTIVLLGPGIWYFAAGTMMRRLSRPALRQAVWVARAQLVIVPCVLLIGIFAGPAGFEREIFIVPVMLTIFFVPALIALLFTFRRIEGLMNAIEPEARGFEALPVQVLPLAAERESRKRLQRGRWRLSTSFDRESAREEVLLHRLLRHRERFFRDDVRAARAVAQDVDHVVRAVLVLLAARADRLERAR